MPEGDTILQAATRLHATLAGHTIQRFVSPLPEFKERDVVGRTVTRVYARGKNLVIELDDGRAIHTHLRMEGVWYVRHKAELTEREKVRFEREPHGLNPALTMILETDAALAVCERAAIAKLAPLSSIERELSSLGPDLLSQDFDAELARHNLRSRPELEIGDAIMLQSLLAGIGNVYKSEVLFLEKLNPFLPIRELDDATLDRLITRARDLMNRNRNGSRRSNFGKINGLKYYVYGRSGEHCLKCDARIGMRRQGSQLRSTYFCPLCQKPT
jgi:endonuclease VIII